MSADRNIRPVAVVEKLYGSTVMISETMDGQLQFPLRGVVTDLLVLKVTIPAVQPNAKMIPACNGCQRGFFFNNREGQDTYQDDGRECEQEKWPFEVLPVRRLILWLVVPEL